MNSHQLADYSARLRRPEIIAQIGDIIREVSTAAGVPARELLSQLHGTHWHRNARLRGEIGRRMREVGFRTRDVAEVFNQGKGTTLSQIQAAQFRHRAASNRDAASGKRKAQDSPASSLITDH